MDNLMLNLATICAYVERIYLRRCILMNLGVPNKEIEYLKGLGTEEDTAGILKYFYYRIFTHFLCLIMTKDLSKML